MLQGSIIFALVVIALTAITFAGYLLFRRGWFVIWLKASFAMTLIMAAVASLLSLLDVLSYQQLMAEVPIATVSIFEKENQHFDLTLVTVEGKEERYQIYGDQWQLDARLLTWVGPLAALGKK
ncbi:MAG: cation/multidrug efflux pump, partial [Oleispira sp.]|nr:cation/multidrug efflux pump [Oleispira sp.]